MHNHHVPGTVTHLHPHTLTHTNTHTHTHTHNCIAPSSPSVTHTYPYDTYFPLSRTPSHAPIVTPTHPHSHLLIALPPPTTFSLIALPTPTPTHCPTPPHPHSLPYPPPPSPLIPQVDVLIAVRGGASNSVTEDIWTAQLLNSPGFTSLLQSWKGDTASHSFLCIVLPFPSVCMLLPFSSFYSSPSSPN